jgi:5-methylcytosine-specific restriction endonuclease McrA
MLNRRVLVLNKHWVVVHICTVRRAMGLLFQELARVVTEDYQSYNFEAWRELSAKGNGQWPVLHSPNFRLRLPQVIVLVRYGKCPPRKVQLNRHNIFLRDHHTCQYCGSTAPKEDLTIDHVIPRSRGGHTLWNNVVLACSRCNMLKGNHLASECGMAPLQKPRRPAWIELQPEPHNGQATIWKKFVETSHWDATPQ